MEVFQGHRSLTRVEESLQVARLSKKGLLMGLSRCLTMKFMSANRPKHASLGPFPNSTIPRNAAFRRSTNKNLCFPPSNSAIPVDGQALLSSPRACKADQDKLDRRAPGVSLFWLFSGLSTLHKNLKRKRKKQSRCTETAQ